MTITRKEALKIKEALKHFANGGDLWHAMTAEKWFKQDGLIVNTTSPTENIIYDKNFEARKAHALGEEVELMVRNDVWKTDSSPVWGNLLYRPKPKEPIYEWQWIYQDYDSRFVLTDGYHTEPGEHTPWTKFEPSKRLRNG